MTKLAKKLSKARESDSNPFASMEFIKFWLISALFELTFLISLGICLVMLEPRRTQQLITALVHDFLQTILLILLVVVLLSWGVWHFMGSLLSG